MGIRSAGERVTQLEANNGANVPKPRVFIGSSVEGLNIAYAVQQNLLHEAEVTVWDQGVFELSRTSIESLTKALTDSDFAVFVFSPDDLVQIRDDQKYAVRDNVLFEFGLFIGRLGRDRVFFLCPDVGHLHLPTDLLGVTPGKYESERADGSMQAATGPVCHQMRIQIRALGIAPWRVESAQGPEGGVLEAVKDRDWISDLLEKRYDDAATALEREQKAQTGEDALVTQAWIIFCALKKDEADPARQLIPFAEQHESCSRVQSLVATMLRWEGCIQQAIEHLNKIKESRPEDPIIASAIAQCYLEEADDTKEGLNNLL